jgi:uncharacterized membrane protein YgdD (TMEM256/DUF423 family)
MERFFGLAGALFGLLGVALGAFGAHGLESRLSPADLETFEIGVRYQMYHALALLGLGLWAARSPGKLLPAAAAAMLLGVAMFSGGLYVMVFVGNVLHWAIVPLGGLALIVGWLLLAVAAIAAAGERN